MYRIINILSIDISLGAIVVSYFFCLVFGVDPHWISLLVLGLSVWMIYTADHLLDARKITSTASTVRHQFHQRNFRLLLTSVMVAGTGVLISLWSLPKVAILAGLLLGGLSMVYLIFQRKLSFLKEGMGAILYTLGILIPVISYSDFVITPAKGFLIFQFLLVVFMNLILFSSFDKQKDETDHRFSIATIFSTPVVNNLIWIMFLLALLVGGVNVFIFKAYGSASVIIFIMSLSLAVIQSRPHYFSHHDRFRYVGDGIFFLPLLYLLFQ